MDYPFGRRRKTKDSLDTESLERVLSSLSVDEVATFNDEDSFGPLGLNTLFSSPQPLLDIIFVHGLQGGSRKTWSSSKRMEHFWPKEWLSRDPGFHHARVHSFGYRSDWTNTKSSILNINHIAETLLASIQSSPSLRETPASKIIFVAHSMGGLLVKKAHIEAHGNPNYQDIAGRIESIFFLGTPHKGSDSAKTAELLVALSPFHGDKPYVKDLQPTSVMIQTISNDFPRYSKRLQLFSFYETLETWAGKSKLIVSPDSAVLGYENEERISMNKNHRGICKFDTPKDPDFILLRNSLCRAMERIIEKATATRYAHDARMLRDLQEYLGVQDKPEDDLCELEDFALPGSALWFLESGAFREWRDSMMVSRTSQSNTRSPGAFRTLWVNAMPGAGKSTLASQVVSHLESINMDCCYYFFSLDERLKSTVNGLLRSIAFQMALLNPSVRDKLLRLKENGIHFDSTKEKLMWRKLFVGGILTCAIDRPQYWVIDALDECRDLENLVNMFSKLETSFPLNILLTSRPTQQIRTKMGIMGQKVSEYSFGIDDIRHNIKRFVQDGLSQHIIQMDSSPKRQRELVEKILKKSEGCFLWVQLVMEKLKHALTPEHVELILDDLPPGMDKLYRRTLAEILETDEEGKKLTKAILSIVACAMNPMTVAELANVLKIQLRITLHESAIKPACGNLIYVDKSSRICLVHQTARDYLLNYGLFETFGTNSTNAHNALANLCLEYLKSSQMRPIRMLASPGPSTSRINRRLETSPFAQYACVHFSDHVRRGSSEDDLLLDSIYRFLSANGLSWIEHVAAGGNLRVLIQTSQNLRGFLQARAKYKPLIDQKSQCVQQWSVDLFRIVAKFGRVLLRLPQSIYGLIPPLVPRESPILSQYNRGKGIDIIGISSISWDDRLCSKSFHGKLATAVASGGSTFAVGLQSGMVFVYDHTTFQEICSFQHQEMVKILQYSSSGNMLVSAGLRRAKLWNVSEGVNVWEEKVTAEPLALSFTKEDRSVVGITRNNVLVVRDSTNGRLLKWTARPYSDSGRGGLQLFPGGDITCASLDVSSNMLATAHRGRPVVISELDTNEKIAQCEPDVDPNTTDFDFLEPAVATEFCPSDVNLIAVIYRDGGLATYDPGAQCALVETVHDFEVEKLACSPDGRTLAVGDSSGTIMLYETETLRLLYKIIHKSNLAIRAMAFSADSQRLIDIRESQCNVWEPPVLMRTEPQETESMSDAIPTHDENAATEEDLVEISAIAATACGNFVLAGSDDGTVALHRTDTGKKIQQLYEHATGSWISQIATSPQTLASIGGTNELIVKSYHANEQWMCEDLIHVHYQEPIRQLLFNSIGSKILVVFSGSVVHFDLSAGGVSSKCEPTSDEIWANDPTRPSALFGIRNNLITEYTWENFSLLSSLCRRQIPSEDQRPLVVQHAAASAGRKHLAVVFSKGEKWPVTLSTALLDCSTFAEATGSPQLLQLFSHSDDIKAEHIIGIHDGKLYFLDKDLWLCSLTLSAKGANCTHHMFIPDEWLKDNNRPLLLLTAKGELVIVKRDEIAIIKRPFTYSIAI
ncbi:WD40/YVTN repeat-like-containing domain [Stemphylium lycopersici]|uniref:GPI inositol-deacylase n=1 Tax=Stemphylium lycopersici TaxID=183478 RepID=A0A364NAM3_STELY|nr:WD40/YVTN repeat-like-containing domain [Stemphylium lycopersici]